MSDTLEHLVSVDDATKSFVEDLPLNLKIVYKAVILSSKNHETNIPKILDEMLILKNKYNIDMPRIRSSLADLQSYGLISLKRNKIVIPFKSLKKLNNVLIIIGNKEIFIKDKKSGKLLLEGKQEKG
jgi:hypothetical protein